MKPSCEVEYPQAINPHWDAIRDNDVRDYVRSRIQCLQDIDYRDSESLRSVWANDLVRRFTEEYHQAGTVFCSLFFPANPARRQVSAVTRARILASGSVAYISFFPALDYQERDAEACARFLS